MRPDPKVWESCAKWPATVVGLGDPDNVSRDKHSTREAAETVCRMLVRDGFGGDHKVFPLKVWVALEGQMV